MKGNKKILAVAILLLLIAVSYGTYAIYKTSVEGDATITAATWNVVFKNGQTNLEDNFTLTFGATDCVNNTHVADGVIAPGATCSKNVTLIATGTQVDVEYEVTADNTGILVDGDDQPANSNTFTASIGSNDGEILMTDSSMTDTITVTLTWGDEEGSSYDSGDTLMAGGTVTVPLTLTAKQMVS